jgi:hypothetical protein
MQGAVTTASFADTNQSFKITGVTSLHFADSHVVNISQSDALKTSQRAFAVAPARRVAFRCPPVEPTKQL